MRLFLASYIKHPDSIARLRKYVNGFEGKKIAYIPTASNGEDGWEMWKSNENGSWKMAQKLGADVETVVLEDCKDKSAVEKLTGKDIVWFAGGMSGYLAYWMKRRFLDIYLPEILGESGVYVGSSAGSMVAGQTLQVSNWSVLDGERGAEGINPMGFVEFDIFPHFRDDYLPDIKKKYDGKKIYLLKDGEEIIVEDNGGTSGAKITVVGEERIITNS